MKNYKKIQIKLEELKEKGLFKKDKYNIYSPLNNVKKENKIFKSFDDGLDKIIFKDKKCLNI